MPHIRSDDGPRKLRAVWLGPKGATLPFEWTYAQWLVCILASMACGLVFLVLLWVVWAPIYGIAASVMYGIPAGFYLGVKAMRKVSYDEPIQYRLAMVRSELTRRGPVADDTPERWDIMWPAIGDLSAGARRALGWTPDPTVPSRGEDQSR